MSVDYSTILSQKDEVLADQLFDNLPRTMRISAFAEATGLSAKTIYDWHHRGSERGIPKNLFFKVGRMLFVNTDVFLDWVTRQNLSSQLRADERGE